eukprot:TRINITY_DN738_c0_g1_i4.p1 TRINITY_DN738_c0_g1~~TRINITY_DN738_c0_g1_i4.p1  ORF type:complete len:518 (-),score=95.76 TRINITY_DN738_c0_g1_i4:3829-5382(-)
MIVLLQYMTMISILIAMCITIATAQTESDGGSEFKSSLAQLLRRLDVASVVWSPTSSQEIDNNQAAELQDLCSRGREIEPAGGINCAKRKEWGSCNKQWMINGAYCAITCGRCNNNQKAGDSKEIGCVDVQVQEEPFSCEDRKIWGGCNVDWVIDGGYCAKACGRCVTDEAATISTPPAQKREQNEQQFGKQQNGNFRFRIIFFSDFHGRVEPQTEWWKDCDWNKDQKGGCFGGVPRMKAVIDQERAKRDMPTMVLNAGDDLVGTAWDWNWRYDGSKAMAHFLNTLGIDAMTLGNHEFDRGPDELLKYINYLDYPVISCNTRAEKHPGLNNKIQGGVIKQLAGVKIGVVGFTVESTADYSNPYPVYFTNKYEAGKRCIDELRNGGANIIIALDHIGFGGDKNLAKLMNHVDLVIGGHSHILLNKGAPPKLNMQSGSRDQVAAQFPVWEWSNLQKKNVPVMQCAHFSRYLCKIEVEFDAQGNLIDLKGSPILLGGYQSESDIQGDAQVWNDMIRWKFW